MAQDFDITAFAEVENSLLDCFNCSVAPIMEGVQRELGDRQAREMVEYSRSAAGILSGMAASANLGSDPYANLKHTGQWNSKTVEDYVDMCHERLDGSTALASNLSLISDNWREAVITQIGRERYDRLSNRLGCDLADAYVSHRINQLMVDKLVDDRIPRSSAEYIIRKVGETSIFGLPQTMQRTPLAAEIDRRSEAAYKPSAAERSTGFILGSATDAVALGGAGSWAKLAKFVGIDLAANVAINHFSSSAQSNDDKVELCISKGVFGSDSNVFTEFRNEAKRMNTAKISNLSNMAQSTFMPQNGDNSSQIGFNFNPAEERERQKQAQARSQQDVPMVVAPGHEEEYRQMNKPTPTVASQSGGTESDSSNGGNDIVGNNTGDNNNNPEGDQSQNLSGWDTFLSNMGLNGATDIGKNLGYSLAKLPDLLVGVLTGKTDSLGLIKDNIVPIAAVVAGMFTGNPLLKLLLMGLGGFNLMNKVGHAALQTGNVPETKNRYKTYEDEPLNPRISNPAITGNSMVMDIDRVPHTVQLPDTVVEAYNSGALPLNVLANAILARQDMSRRMAAQNYDSSQQRNEVITRSRTM
ncbi:MAG: hypothetical protein Q4Q28_04755 [Bacteroidales bacterium]|nr:hypothetical protein [Bacteroidales bacterium]